MFHMEPGDGGKEGDRCKQRRRERASEQSAVTVHKHTSFTVCSQTNGGDGSRPTAGTCPQAAGATALA